MAEAKRRSSCRSISLVVLTIAAASAVYTQDVRSVDIIAYLTERLSKQETINSRPVRIQDICPIDTDPLSARILREYGSVFVSAQTVTFPKTCIFDSDEQLLDFQRGLKTASARIGGVEIELQEAAMQGLLDAIAEAESRSLVISPRGGRSAARRSYADTKRLWDSRFLPGLDYWTARGKISAADAKAARKMSVREQVNTVLDWESKGYFFSTGKDRTILSSVAAPGTSQHLSMLAFDVAQFADVRVRSILNRHGWFQTVADDTPHFTYLGVSEDELPSVGLQYKIKNGYKFWVPNIK